MKNDDAERVHSALAGDDNAFSLLIKKYQPWICEFALHKTGDPHVAEEITGDAFLRAYQKLDTLKEPQNFARWLRVIANRCCIDWLRKERLAMIQSLEDNRCKETEAQNK